MVIVIHDNGEEYDGVDNNDIIIDYNDADNLQNGENNNKDIIYNNWLYCRIRQKCADLIRFWFFTIKISMNVTAIYKKNVFSDI